MRLFRKRKRPLDWLASETGRSLPEWIRYVESRIKANTRSTDDPNHGKTDAPAWIRELVREIERVWEIGSFDENMRLCRIMGVILCAWYSRVHHAKSMDPKRPIKLRREAYERRRLWLAELTAALHDGRFDQDIWPGQEWESPFLSNARNGDFV